VLFSFDDDDLVFEDFARLRARGNELTGPNDDPFNGGEQRSAFENAY
jgi:hypothetical protein